MSEKHPYLAMIFDFVRIPHYNNSEKSILDKSGNSKIKIEKKFLYYQKEYSNKRWALYCTCGQMTEIPLGAISKNHEDKLISNQLIFCKNCNKTYTSLLDVKIIYSRSPLHNVTSKRFSVVEKENFYALYSFATTVFVSITTKKLIFKDISNHSLYFSKKSNAIRMKKGEKIITVPFKYLVKHCSLFIDNMILNALYENKISQGLFERQVINPLIKFCEIIESKCDTRDVDRINETLEKERNDVYYNTLFNSCDKYSSDSLFFYSRNCSYDLKSINTTSNKMSVSRYIWMQYLKRRLSIMFAISAYPPVVTLFLTYGPDKFIDLFSNSSLMCSLTSLKKKKPTNPKDILEVMFKGKIASENSKNLKIKKYLKTEEKKRKRKLKANLLKKGTELKKDLLFPITTHPTEYVDSRVPIHEDIKLKLKNLYFRKSYADLFLENNFDETAKVFYAILKNTSVFDNILTIDKIILNKNVNFPIETTFQLIIGLQNMYDQNSQRLGMFKINYTHFFHILKITQNNKTYINADSVIFLYVDTIFMLQMIEMPLLDIFKVKNIKDLEDMHNSLLQSYNLILDSKLNEKLKLHINKFRHTEGVFNNIKFNLIDTPERFFEESSIMNHCVKTYCSDVANGHYIIYSIEDIETGNRATLSVNTKEIFASPKCYKDVIYTFNQLKAKNNAKATERIIDSVKDFIYKFFEIKDCSKHYDLQITIIKEVIKEEDEILILNNLIAQEHNINEIF